MNDNQLTTLLQRIIYTFCTQEVALNKSLEGSKVLVNILCAINVVKIKYQTSVL